MARSRCYFFAIIWKILILLSVKADFELQVLHTNDIQSRFEQTDEYGNMCPDSYPQKGGPCIGGFARLKSAVERFTKEAKNQNNIPSIFLNAGDTFQGSINRGNVGTVDEFVCFGCIITNNLGPDMDIEVRCGKVKIQNIRNLLCDR